MEETTNNNNDGKPKMGTLTAIRGIEGMFSFGVRWLFCNFFKSSVNLLKCVLQKWCRSKSHIQLLKIFLADHGRGPIACEGLKRHVASV